MSYIHNRLQQFTRPAFTLYVISCFLATFGGGLSYIAISWMIVQVDASVAALVILMACFWLPNVLFGLFAGVIADRFERKWVLFIANAVRGVVLLLFAILFARHYTCDQLYMLGLILGFFFSLYMPTSVAFVREIIPEQELLYANATVDIAYEVGNVVGMGAAGAVIAFSSYADTLYVNGFLLLLSSILLLMIKPKWLHYKSKKVLRSLLVWRDLREGLQYIVSNKPILVIYTVQLLLMCQYMTAPTLLAPFAKDVLHANVDEFGHIEAALSVSVVIGGFIIPWVADRIGVVKTILVFVLFSTLSFVWFGINRNLLIAETLYFFIGFGFAIWSVVLTKAQDLTRLDFQGRVQASFNCISGAIILLIYILVGMTSRLASVQYLFSVEVLLCLTTIIVAWRYRHLLRHH